MKPTDIQNIQEPQMNTTEETITFREDGLSYVNMTLADLEERVGSKKAKTLWKKYGGKSNQGDN